MHVVMHVRPHLNVFQTVRLLVPWVEIKLELFCNTSRTSIVAKCLVTLKAEDLKVKLYLCHVTLNANVYKDLKEKHEADSHLAWYPVVHKDTTMFEKDDVFVSPQSYHCGIGRLPSRNSG